MLDLQIKSDKSSCLRIGNKFRSYSKLIISNNKLLDWVSESKYLGIFIKSGCKFACNWQSARSNFYKSFNGILGVLGHNPSIDVVLTLTRTNCIPVLNYGTETTPLTDSELRSFSYAYNSIFCKLFKSNDIHVIEQCQYHCGFLPFYALYDYHRYVFLVGQFRIGLIRDKNVFSQADFKDLKSIAVKYNFNFADSKSYLMYKVWKLVESSICSTSVNF